MKYIFYISLLIVLSITAACSGPQSLTIQERNSDVTMDGNLSDWNTGSSLIKSDEGLNIYAKNDSEFLYLFIDVKSARKDQVIQRSGLIIYIGDSKETRKDRGIGFPSGSFNLLRENPGVYQTFLNDPEWSQDPSNRELLEDLSDNIFDRVMIVERFEDNDTNYGFIDLEQLNVDGFQIAKSESGRFTSMEMKIPIDGSSIYNVESDRLWVGLSVEPPRFRMQDNQNDVSNRQQRRGQYGNRQPRQNTRAQQQSAMRRNLGEYEEWLILELNK